MKFVSLLAVFAMAVASTHAAECTTSKIEEVQSKPEFKKAQTACASAQSLTSGGADEETVKKICKESDCLNSLSAAFAVLPDCTVQGQNIKDTYQLLYKTLQDGCKDIGVPVASSPSTATSTTAPAASGASSFALSATAAAVAVVALAQQ